jgi:hypothetical protein
MPNWCNNGVTITHEDPEKIAALAEAMRKNEFCDYVIPVPAALKDTISGGYGDKDQQAALERQTAENIEKYGYGNWYDFCVAHWGTKWDVDLAGTVNVSECGTIVDVGFDSAWSPPVGVYEKLVEQGYDVVAFYYEPGMGFVGKWDNGYDDCIEYGGETSETVRSAIGEELDDYFGISESMAEWEAENEEDEEELTEWIKDGVEARKEADGILDK